VIALIALLVFIGIALRGYLPGERHAAADQPSHNPVGLIGVITLLAASIAIITIAIITTLRQPRTPRQSGQPLRDSHSGNRTWPSRRALLILAGLILAWLIFVVLLLQLSSLIDLGHPSATTAVTTAPASNTTVAPRPAPPPAPGKERGDVFWYLLGTTIFLIVLWVIGVVIAWRRHRRELQPQPFGDGAREPEDQPPAPHSLAVAAERGLAEMGDLSREPREAIIACYAAMEGALSNAPGAMPQDSDTPSEVLARAVAHHAIHAGTATELVDVFTEARFSPHVMNETHREIAMRGLHMVLAELKSTA
jgi:hypothetical protein